MSQEYYSYNTQLQKEINALKSKIADNEIIEAKEIRDNDNRIESLESRIKIMNKEMKLKSSKVDNYQDIQLSDQI